MLVRRRRRGRVVAEETGNQKRFLTGQALERDANRPTQRFLNRFGIALCVFGNILSPRILPQFGHGGVLETPLRFCLLPVSTIRTLQMSSLH